MFMLLFVFCMNAIAGDDVYVRGHYRNGSWVSAHYRSSPTTSAAPVFRYSHVPDEEVVPARMYSCPAKERTVAGNLSVHDAHYANVFLNLMMKDNKEKVSQCAPYLGPAGEKANVELRNKCVKALCETARVVTYNYTDEEGYFVHNTFVKYEAEAWLERAKNAEEKHIRLGHEVSAHVSLYGKKPEFKFEVSN